MRNNTVCVMNALDASVDHTSAIVIDARQVVAMSAQAVMTGAATGTLNIQASNDVNPAVGSNGAPAPTNWSTIATVGTIALAAGTVTLLPKFDVAYQWIRANYVKNNGSAGTVTVNINTKGFA
jgi:hypothetical protein